MSGTAYVTPKQSHKVEDEGEEEKIEESLIVKNKNEFLSLFHVINFCFDVSIILICMRINDLIV